MAPSKMVAWECGACRFTNEDMPCRDCQMCMTERPVRYAIVAGANGVSMVRTTTVNCHEQARIAALAAVLPAAVMAVAPADVEQAPAIVEEQPAAPVNRARAANVAHVVVTMVWHQ